MFAFITNDTKKDFYLSNCFSKFLFVGMTIGLFRTVIPALAEERFSVPVSSLLLLSSFIAIFGIIKGLLNFVSGYFSDIFGRRKILIFGWIVALPIPWILAYATDWIWIIVATLLLSINQGICWSMSQIMKLDITQARRYGTAISFNETLGYCGVALSAYLSAYLTYRLGITQTMLILGLIVVLSALLSAILFCKETKQGDISFIHRKVKRKLFFWDVSWKNKYLMALNLAGLVEKFVDCLVWLIYPVFLYQQKVSLVNIGIITGVYGGVWESHNYLLVLGQIK